MMSEERFGWQVRQVLNRSTQGLPPTVENRLAQARAMALARKKADNPLLAIASARRLSFAGGQGGVLGSDSFSAHWMSSLGGIIPALALIFGIWFVFDIQQNEEANALAEIDAQVLVDDLPLDAYLDQGFSMFVGHKAQEESTPASDTPANDAGDTSTTHKI